MEFSNYSNYMPIHALPDVDIPDMWLSPDMPGKRKPFTKKQRDKRNKARKLALKQRKLQRKKI